MTIYNFHSTMLPSRVERLYDSDNSSDNEYDDLEDYIVACKDLAGDYPTAEFRLSVETDDASVAWVRDKLDEVPPSRLSPLSKLKLLERTSYGSDSVDCAVVMLAKQGLEADTILRTLDNDEFVIAYGGTHDQAYADLGKKMIEEDVDNEGRVPEALEGYVNYTAYGRDRCDATIEYHDGDIYALYYW